MFYSRDNDALSQGYGESKNEEKTYFGDRTDGTSSYTVNRQLIPEFVLEKSQIIVYLTRQTDFTLTSCKVNRLNLECELNGLIKFTY